MSYRLTPNSQSDIEAIGDYFADRNPYAAVKLLNGFVRRWEFLATQPYCGMPRDDILPNVRHLVMGGYLAFYRVDGKDVVILRVLHGRRNITADDIPA
ncbi:MAG: type II toxin-antitoxin system RelE/ParE family toxin [Pseudaminobacter sp.]|nr:type II toxin-antitoxin system RelE/ParE family toxin [Pseudaminobacter sp.]